MLSPTPSPRTVDTVTLSLDFTSPYMTKTCKVNEGLRPKDPELWMEEEEVRR